MANTEMDYMNIGMGNVIGIDNSQSPIYTFSAGSTTSGAASETWQATEDCIVAGYIVYSSTSMGDNAAAVAVSYTDADISSSSSGVRVATAYATVSDSSGNKVLYAGVYVPVKKGQYVWVRSLYSNINQVKAYKPLY